MTRFALLCVAILVSVAGGAISGRAQSAANGDPDRGKQIYLAIGCAYCHGTVGQGGGGRTGGLRLSHMGIAYPAFLNQLRHPVNEMPPYVESALPDSEAADIYAYIASLPAPPDVSTIPILNN